MATNRDADAVGLAVGLVNTWDLLADPPDLIRDVPQIARWLRLHEEPGLEEAAARLTSSDLNRLRGVRDRLQLVESDVFEKSPDERFDIIVSNPPYVPAADIEGLQLEVRDFEPYIALSDGHDGLSIISRIIEQSPRFLVSGGFLLMEIGFNQSPLVARMFESSKWKPPELFPDLQGIPRLICSELI